MKNLIVIAIAFAFVGCQSKPTKGPKIDSSGNSAQALTVSECVYGGGVVSYWKDCASSPETPGGTHMKCTYSDGRNEQCISQIK